MNVRLHDTKKPKDYSKCNYAAPPFSIQNTITNINQQ